MKGKANVARGAAVLAIAMVAYFAVAAVATHLVNTQYDFVRDYISDYAVGPWGWIYGSAFIASCVGSIALALALGLALPHDARSNAGILLLVIVGISYVVDFVFPTDILMPGQRPQTEIGIIHFADAALGWVLFVVAAFLISYRLDRAGYLRNWRRALVALTWTASLVLLALLGILIAGAPIGGLVEKTFILVRNLWALTLAITIMRASGLSHSASHVGRAATSTRQ